MFGLFRSANNSMKGFKVSTNKARSKKVGIAANSIENLRTKVKLKFDLETFKLFLSDGSLIEDEDYFNSLPAQSLIIVAEDGEEVKTDLQLIIEQFRKINHEILQAKDLVHEFVENNKDCDLFKALSHVQGEIEEKIVLTLRSEDPDWFQGIDSKITTKEDLMRRKAQDRIRGYFYKTKDELTKSPIYRSNINCRKIIDDLLTDFFLFLNGVDYFSCLFDRTHKERFVKSKDETDATKFKTKRRRIDSATKTKISESDLFKKFQVTLCNELGGFDCHGIWNSKDCGYKHKINPYSSRESVVLFQIFNLDHQIEISRSIFPSILNSVEDFVNGKKCDEHDKKAVNISILTYFQEIFTVGNLKLVHIVCHDKGTHDKLKSKGRVICEKSSSISLLQFFFRSAFTYFQSSSVVVHLKRKKVKYLFAKMASQSSIFDGIEMGPPIEVFALNKAFLEDDSPNKVNLGVGAYRTEEGKPWVLPVVKKAEKEIVDDTTLNHEYLAVLGLDTFSSAATALLLGDDSIQIKNKNAFGLQTLSGTGALRVGAEFLANVMGRRVFYYSDPTWENHQKVFITAGFTDGRTYRYWDAKTRQIDFDGFCTDLKNAPEGAVIILHACAHNPTGCDPTKEQWVKLADIIEEKKLFPFFDSAYQGFASGDPVHDAFAVRYFVERGFELFCSQSFAKNFGLYNERVGNLTVVQQSPKTSAAVQSRMTLLVRYMYSNPPAFGGRIVSKVLNTPDLRQEWMDSIRTMSSRIIKMRNFLKEELLNLKTPGTWDHITQQIGMFSYTGLNETQVKMLIDKYHIYLLSSGRINMCGLNEKNYKYVANSIHETILATKDTAKL